MSIIIFILILGALIFVHELGHFLTAKKSGIRVDEFAIGFPPKLFSITKGGTRYALNLIPFGGYVKIFGENPNDLSLDPNSKDSFVNKSKWIQAMVIVAGVFFNFLFAWLLLSISFMSGFPSVVTEDTRGKIQDIQVAVTGVLPDSPAGKAGLSIGDRITNITSGGQSVNADFDISTIQNFIGSRENEELVFFVKRGNEDLAINVTPVSGIVEEKAAVGITMDNIGLLKVPFHIAIVDGLKTSVTLTKEIAVGLSIFLYQAVTGQADLGMVAGPVGIVNLVGDASEFGFIYLLGFTAFISLNLAVLNLIPFPALDGGRLLFIIIEAISRRPIPTKVANVTNAIGFSLLILLMVIITISDVVKLF